MKKIIYLIFLSIIFSHNGFTDDRLTVLDLYNKYESDKLILKNGEWFLSSQPYRGNRGGFAWDKIIVDNRNGYIYLRGCVSVSDIKVRQYALYRNNRAKYILAKSTYEYGPAGCENVKIKFLKYQNSSFSDVTSNILHQISFRDFLNERHLNQYREQNELLDSLLVYFFELPIHGTIIKVKFNTSLLSINYTALDINMNGSPRPADRMKWEKANKLIEELKTKLKYREIHLEWDGIKERFYIVKKISRD